MNMRRFGVPFHVLQTQYVFAQDHQPINNGAVKGATYNL
jgi:hypothetical protein